MSVQFEGIYFNQSRVAGEVRMSADGLGWRATPTATGGSAAKVSKPFLLPASELLSATWSRGSHGYMVQIQTRSGATVSLDGFEDDFVPLQRALNSNLSLQLEHHEHSLRGWNWGKIELERNQMVMNVASKPDFGVPYHSIANSNVIGKSEVAIELALPSSTERTTAGDEVVEMRFYLPGTQVDGENDEEDGQDTVTSAQAFHDALQEHADIGSAAGSELAQFVQVLFTTPRGRYDIQFFGDVFRLHGKTYDYKVPFTSLQRIFMLPRLDEQHNIVVIQLDPPLRQGQTRYPFLVMQFGKEEEIEVELNVDDETFKSEYEGKIERKYDAAADEVVVSLLKGLSGRKVIHASAFKSTRNMPGVSCMSKAVEAVMYPLEKALLLVSKAPVYVPYTEIAQINFNRVAQGNRTFDMAVKLKSNQTVPLTGLAREDQMIIEQYFQSKNIATKNDAVDARRAKHLDLDENMEEESEEDEDFEAESESDSEMSDDSGSDSGAESFDEELEESKPKRQKK